MRKKLFGIMAALLAGAGTACAQYGAVPDTTPQVFPGTGPIDQQYLGASPLATDMGQYMQAQNQTPPASSPQNPALPSATANPSTCAPSSQLCCPEPWKIKGWIGADFQMWFPPAMNLAPNLVTSLPAGAGTQLVGTSFPLPIILGFRIDTGMFTNPEESRGFQSITNSFFANTGVITVTPPAFVNTNGGATTLPLTAAGPNTFSANTSFTDTDANSILRLINGPNTKVYAIYGPKFATVEEDMTFTYNSFLLGPGAILEEFHTRNYFIGGQAGIWVKENIGPFVADLQAA
ncbi:MAG TPA: hypothetical protein VKS79_06735, partial [Gemmataceae bacterium]|nr:hypothetical protein [Gemmataceae bacterium]